MATFSLSMHNYWLTSYIKPGIKSWVWNTVVFTEGELSLESCSLRHWATQLESHSCIAI